MSDQQKSSGSYHDNLEVDHAIEGDALTGGHAAEFNKGIEDFLPPRDAVDAEMPTANYTVEFEGENLFVDSVDWRKSRLLKFQILSAYFLFTLFGLAEQTVGTLISVFQQYYNIHDIQTSFIFLASLLGFFTSAMLNEMAHRKLGIKGVLIMGCTNMTIAHLIISFKPPYFILILSYIINGTGCGFMDAALNTWMGYLLNSNELLGILHGCFGLGCMISPALITYLLEKDHPWTWNQYYVLISGFAAFCLMCLIISFRYETATKFRYNILLKSKKEAKNDSSNSFELDTLRSGDGEEEEQEDLMGNSETRHGEDTEAESFNNNSSALSSGLKSRVVWSFAMLLALYVGGEAAFGSWLITFLTRINKYSFKKAAHIATVFWLGITSGRIVLGFVTGSIFRNELNANLVYIALSFTGFLLFWIFSGLSTSIPIYIIVFLTGASVGPIFPTTIVCALKILPVSLHVIGVGMASAFAGGGAALIPFVVGTVAESTSIGLKAFPFIITTAFGILVIMWLVMMRSYGSIYRKTRI